MVDTVSEVLLTWKVQAVPKRRSRMMERTKRMLMERTNSRTLKKRLASHKFLVQQWELSLYGALSSLGRGVDQGGRKNIILMGEEPLYIHSECGA